MRQFLNHITTMDAGQLIGWGGMVGLLLISAYFFCLFLCGIIGWCLDWEDE